MKTHSFTLLIENVDEITIEMANKLYEAGCDDGSLHSRDGHVYVDFDRKAPTLHDAIKSAQQDVGEAGFRSIYWR
jgi:hypothetical protein